MFNMHSLGPRAHKLMQHPGAFALQTLRSFRANQGLLLAGAVAYYALLSIVPLLILIVIGLSHVIDPSLLLDTLGHYLEWLVPGQSAPILRELASFLEHREVVGWVLLGTMVFFSSLAFTVLENAMSVIFVHRVAIRRRHFMLSALLPYCYMLCLGLGLLLVTVVSGGLQVLGEKSLTVLDRSISLDPLSGMLLYALGIVGQVFLLTSIYLVMPVGRLSLQHALIGGITATVLWEITRHLLVWYFASLSTVGIVYGSFTTVIVMLLSLELGAALLLLGAQVISEYERIDEEVATPSPFTAGLAEPLREAARAHVKNAP